MSTKTKLFTSDMPGAPVLSGTAGALIAVLEAVLVDGFGLQTASGVTITAGVATVTVPSAPSAAVDSVVLVAGATPAGLNGEHRVTAVTNNSVSFATSETGAVTGTVTIKAAPAGWSKVYSGTNKAAYKITDPMGTGCYLRVDDSGATSARVRGYESMTDVDNGLGLFPTVAQQAGDGYWWTKSNGADSSPRSWKVLADTCAFYYFFRHYPPHYHSSGFFGDIVSLRSGDNYRCAMQGYVNERYTASNPANNEAVFSNPSVDGDGFYLARAANAVGGSVRMWGMSSLAASNWCWNGWIGGGNGVYPSQTDNGLMLTRLVVLNPTSIRGYRPGLYGTPQNVLSGFGDGDIVQGTGDMNGKRLMALKTGHNTDNPGMLFMDHVSDWR